MTPSVETNDYWHTCRSATEAGIALCISPELIGRSLRFVNPALPVVF